MRRTEKLILVFVGEYKCARTGSKDQCETALRGDKDPMPYLQRPEVGGGTDSKTQTSVLFFVSQNHNYQLGIQHTLIASARLQHDVHESFLSISCNALQTNRARTEVWIEVWRASKILCVCETKPTRHAKKNTVVFIY